MQENNLSVQNTESSFVLVEKREYLFTLDNGLNIYSVDCGEGGNTFWFSTSDNIFYPPFDIRCYVKDALKIYYEEIKYNHFIPYAEKDKFWHEKVKEWLNDCFENLGEKY